MLYSSRSELIIPNEINKKEIIKIMSLIDNNQYKELFEEFKGIDSKLHPKQEIINEFLKGQLSDIEFKQPADLGQLLKYCYRVAGVVGLMICDVLDIHNSKLKKKSKSEHQIKALK